MVAGLAVLASGAAVPLIAGAAIAAGPGSGVVTQAVGRNVMQHQKGEYNRPGSAGILLLAMRVNQQSQAGEVASVMRESRARELRNRMK
ncbi:hypothetical protein B2M20_17315, partial [Nitrobacter vulgaris]